MKVEPRATKLVRIWNGNPRHTFDEVLKAYKLGMRTFGDHMAVCDLLQTWLLAVPPMPFAKMLALYLEAHAVVQEIINDENPLLEAIEIADLNRPPAPNTQEARDEAWRNRHKPMAPTVRTKEPVKRFATPYLDGHRRTMGR